MEKTTTDKGEMDTRNEKCACWRGSGASDFSEE